MTELCVLAQKYGSDKCPQTNHHSYTPFYFELFKNKRKQVKKVLEMGVGHPRNMWHYKNYKMGASMYMWRDFFPNAQIYGADIFPGCIFKTDRIETFLCDQSDEESLKPLVKKTGADIDLFVDDGSHQVEHQVLTCKTLMPLLKKGVIYIIEDMIDPNMVARDLAEYDTELVRFPMGRGKDDTLLVVRQKGPLIS